MIIHGSYERHGQDRGGGTQNWREIRDGMTKGGRARQLRGHSASLCRMHCSSPGRRLTFSENSEKILGNSRARPKILGVTGREFREILGILHRQTASFVGAQIR